MRRLTTWMLLLAAVVVGIVVSPSRADGNLDVNIESLSPQLLDCSQPDQRVTMTETVYNNTNQVAKNTNVHFWRSTRAITEHDGLEQALTFEPLQSSGRRAMNSKEDYRELGELAPGASVKLTASTTIGELTSSLRMDSAHMLGARTRSNFPRQDPATVGRDGVFAVAAKKPLQVSIVVRLTIQPTLLDGTDFQDNSLEPRLVGELLDLLAAAKKPGVYTLLDSSLLVEVQAPAGEHIVASQAAPPSETVSNFVKRINNPISTGRMMRLPFGSPNLTRLHAVGDLNGFEAALERSETVLKAVGLGTIADAPLTASLGRNDPQDLTLTLAPHGFRKVFGNNFTSSGEITIMDHSIKAHALRVSPLGLPGTGSGSTLMDAQVFGRRLAGELLGGSPAIHMVREATNISHADLLAGSETTTPFPEPSDQARYETPVEQITPWPGLHSQMQGIFDSIQLLEELTGTDRTALNVATVAQAFSSVFHSEQEAMEFVSATSSEKLALSTIRLSAASQLVMGFDANNFSVMINNPFPITVRVWVRFVNDSPNRIRVIPSELVALDPGEYRAASVSPSTTSNGAVTVRAQLTAEQGTAFGSVVPVEITTTGLERVGWAIIAISGAVVVGGIFLHTRVVQRKRARESRE